MSEPRTRCPLATVGRVSYGDAGKTIPVVHYLGQPILLPTEHDVRLFLAWKAVILDILSGPCESIIGVVPVTWALDNVSLLPHLGVRNKGRSSLHASVGRFPH